MTTFAGSRFVGGQYPNGFGIRFEQLPDGSALATYTFDLMKQGPPKLVHGGAIATVLDEAMTAVVFWAERPAFTVNLTIDYRLPVPIGDSVLIRAFITHSERRKIFLRALLEFEDGTIAAEARALFLESPKLAQSVIPQASED